MAIFGHLRCLKGVHQLHYLHGVFVCPPYLDYMNLLINYHIRIDTI